MPRKKPVSGFKAIYTYFGQLGARALRGTYWYIKRSSKWRLAALALAGCLVLGVCTFGFLFLRAQGGAYGKMPTLAELALVENSEASSVISEDGQVIAKYYRVNRISVPLDEISPFVTKGLVATEDSRFFEHQGVDARALFRVLVKTIAMGDRSSGGGSTISQQLAKQLYPRQHNGSLSILKTKIREMIIASRLEEVYTKEELLALYLNTVPFGENAYGIEVASRRFFNKPAVDLRAEEAAVLVGLLKANTTYNPRTHPQESQDRRDVVLALMARNGSLTQSQSDSLRAIELKTDYRRFNVAVGSAPHFRQVLRSEVEKALVGKVHPDRRPYDIDGDGLRIHVSINSHLQRYAEQAVREELPKAQLNFSRDWRGHSKKPWDNAFRNAVERSRPYRQLAAAGLSEKEIDEALARPKPMTIYDPIAVSRVDTTMSSIDSLRHYFTMLNAGMLVTQGRDGVVRAWVGGIDYGFVQYDHVKARRQMGSTIKPVVYATALQEGMMPCEYTPAQQFTIEDFQDYQPRNANGKYEGAYSMRGALAKSVNTVAVNVAVRTGLDRFAAEVRELGIEGDITANPSLALGTVEASLPEINTVYSSFANGGVRPDGIHFLDKITTADGTVLVQFERPVATKRVMPDTVAATATYLLAGVVNSGTGAKLRSQYGLAGPIAGKTGTTQDQSDGWFVGFTPKLVVSTWVGAEYPAVHFRTLSRGSATATALPIWGNFMRKLQDAKGLKFYKGGNFPELDDLALALVQCPDYLEEMPVYYVDELDAGEGPIPGSVRSGGRTALAQFPSQDVERMMRKKRRRNNESAGDYANRIARYLEREREKEERRKKRGKLWVERLFGG
ncbi:transglycosylase domain-containing protein [Lewinella sp. 4G2]|uniref:transglycosylase domain-containing protein n=1 Tax=Lewinella sp. 4G2 TaxID=1803372 RepID=UPI0007B4B235|nr:transglycosylase domain-containing protein [Lewinella sp. 4G2]OAV43869.1 hypothetical protein A3850_004865 [Lewinella sp. 4G2]